VHFAAGAREGSPKVGVISEGPVAVGALQARLVDSSQSRVAKMEAADPSVSIDLLVRTLLALKLSRREPAQVMESRESTPATS
jgi:hypothetical protein